MRTVLALALVIASAQACKKSSEDKGGTGGDGSNTGTSATKPSAPPQAAWYLAVVTDPAKGPEIPFRLEIPAPGSKEAAGAYGGEGKIAATLERSADGLTLGFEIYHTKIVAKKAADGSLKGEWKSNSPTWGEATLTFTAKPVADVKAPLFNLGGEAIPPAELAGAWRIDLADSKKDAKLILGSEGNELAGRIEFSTGNIVFLRGGAAGGQLRMSGFDGSSPYLLEGKLAGDKLEGQWVAGAGLAWRETLTGTRGDFELEKELALDAKKKLDYEQINAAAYKGKPLIIELAGSWCSTCKRASPFLVDLYNKNKDKGLQMLTLVYEFTEDSDYNKKQAATFKQKYKIPWEVVAVDGDLESYWKIVPNTLTDVNPAGFPVSIFVKPSGEVVDVHAGFPVEGADSYETVTTKYTKIAAELVQGGGD